MTRKKKHAANHAATEIAVQRLAEVAGVELTQQGSDLTGKCPFHEDAGTSLVVRPAANTWACSVCEAGGSAVEWVMRAEGVSRRHALELLAEGAPRIGTKRVGTVKTGTVRKLPPPVTPDSDDAALLRQVVDYYHSTLKQSPEALQYLEERGLRSGEAIERFKIGYGNRTLGLRLPAKNRRLGAELRARLTSIGVIRSTGHEHMNGCVVVPVFDGAGQVLGAYGRKVTPNLRPGTALHLWLPGPVRGVWNADGLADHRTVILAKGLVDALTFWCAGYRNVTAVLGPPGTGVSDALLQALQAAGVQTLLLAFRRDAAGEKATDALAATLTAAGLGAYRVLFPAGKDANEYARTAANATRALGQVLRQAVWLGKGKGAEVDVEAVPAPIARKAPAAIQEPSPVPGAVSPASGAPDAPSAILGPSQIVPALVADDASPEPPPPATPDVPAEVSGEEVVIHLSGRRYRVRGLARNMSYDTMRVNVLVTHDGDPEALHADSLELYSARQRGAFVKQAAAELGLREEALKRDLGAVLLKLEALQEVQIKAALEPKRREVQVDDADRAAALDLLRAPDLVQRILADFERCGVVGEETNKLVAYLAAVSRKLDDPLAVIIQSSSAAGKTSLMEAVLAFVPEEDRLRFSAMTGQSLFYMGETDLQHRILAIAEEEGAERASYALKLLQSEGELTIASTGKDPNTGRLVAQEYRVVGPVMLFLTTTAIDLDEELLNRAVLLTVDEERAQTRAIHVLQRQRQTLEGLLARRDREQVLKLHRDAQRLLRPLVVANPYAPELTFLDDRTRTRRDHGKYLTLIRAIALLHQHQRRVQTVEHGGEVVEYIEVERSDIALANKLAHQVLGRSLDDVPPQARRLLLLLERMVAEGSAHAGIERRAFRFSRRDVRAFTGWSDFQVRTHIEKLVALEYVLVHRGGRGHLFSYELLYDGQGHDGAPFLMGLLDVEKLNHEGSQGENEGPAGEFEGSVSPHGALTEAAPSPTLGKEKPSEPAPIAADREPGADHAPTDPNAGPSYPHTEGGA